MLPDKSFTKRRRSLGDTSIKSSIRNTQSGSETSRENLAGSSSASESTELKRVKAEIDRKQDEEKISRMIQTENTIWEMFSASPHQFSGDILLMLAQVKDKLSADDKNITFKKPKKVKKLSISNIHGKFKPQILESESWASSRLDEYLEQHGLVRMKDVFKMNENSSNPTLLPSCLTKEVITARSDVSLEKQLFEPHPTKKNVITLIEGSIDHLLDLLTLPFNTPLKAIWDYDRFLHQFLIVYPSFISLSHLLEKLFNRFEDIAPSIDGRDGLVKSSILKIIHHLVWVERASDWSSKSKLLYDSFKLKVGKSYSSTLLGIDELWKQYQTTPSSYSPPNSHEPSSTSSISSILDLNPIDLARQLTVIESGLFNKIKRKEFLNGNWYKKTRQTKAPNLLALIGYANKTTLWITTEILKQPTTKLRTEAISFFIQVMQELEILKNFNGIIQVLSSLHSSTISKMKTVWSLIPKKEKETFQTITNLMSNVNHYRAYHHALSQIDSSTPCIPLISVICSDLYAIDDTLPDTTPSGSINWLKMEVVADCVAVAKQFGHIHYNLVPNMHIQNYINSSECWNDQSICYEIAALHEKFIDNKDVVISPTEDLWNRYQLTDQGWEKIISLATCVNYIQGQKVLEVGKTNNALYVVKSGTLKVIKKKGGHVHLLHENDVFGEIGMLLSSQKGVTTADVEVESEKAQVYVIQYSLIVSSCVADPEISASFNLYIARNLVNKIQNSIKNANFSSPGILRVTKSTPHNSPGSPLIHKQLDSRSRNFDHSGSSSSLASLLDSDVNQSTSGSSSPGSPMRRTHTHSVNRSDYTLTSLYAAINDSNEGRVHDILVKSALVAANVNTPGEIYGRTSVHVACVSGNINIVKLLVKYKADIKIKDSRGWYPIHCAAFHLHLEIIEYLLKLGHDPNVQNLDGNTCLHYIVRKKGNGSSQQQLTPNSTENHIMSVIDMLICFGADINIENKFGETALHVAAVYGTPSIVTHLIKRGINVNIKTKQNMGPLDLAKTTGKTDIIQILQSLSSIEVEVLNSERDKLKLLYSPSSSDLSSTQTLSRDFATVTGVISSESTDDKKFLKLFQIPNEKLKMKVTCVMKKSKFNPSVVLYLSEHFICFVSSMFGLKMKEIIDLTTVTDVTISGKKTITIQIKENSVS
eukprot:TRINITY_DN5298_c0_g1_i1.p1 TRINITY_DN5298_c0_g1~~TRINITY_DN5298_c0_g1_i1.p1  ORF type:complete len:1157 (-),score=176.02 TRINITY_DN5298_c0_g1_i1:1379-4849(-)